MKILARMQELTARKKKKRTEKKEQEKKRKLEANSILR